MSPTGPTALSPVKPEKRSKKKTKKKDREPIVRNVLFVHVRINRFHCRGTYHVRSPVVPLNLYQYARYLRDKLLTCAAALLRAGEESTSNL